MKSMTGFGFCTLNNKDFKLEISIKSINSRFLDIKLFTPSYYLNLEPELKKMISQNCKRGSLVISINRFPHKPFPNLSLKSNKQQAEKWKQLYHKLSKELKIKNDLSFKDLLNCKGVLNVIEKPQNLTLIEKNLVKKTFTKSLKSCLKERTREGAVLKKDILSHLKAIQNFIEQIKKLNKKQTDLHIKKKTKQIKKNRDSLLETEKFDINEEIVRVIEHLNQFKKIVNKPIDVGRKMDFYLQEILREINTIGSKSNLSELTLKVVEAKFYLEKIKEQAQNVE